jgi:hypothetical protein
MLETIIDNYDEESSLSVCVYFIINIFFIFIIIFFIFINIFFIFINIKVKLQVLTATMKLFFKRAPEVHSMLGRLLSSAVNDSSNQDIHDRALLYYRILSTDLTVAGIIILIFYIILFIYNLFISNLIIRKFI